MQHQLLYRPMEFWKQITSEMVEFDIEPWYWISTEGRVYSTISNKILKPTPDRDGYLTVSLYVRGIRKQHMLRIHRLVMLAFYPNPNNTSLQVNHLNGIKNINDEFNLEWATASENVRHAFTTGLHPVAIGENNSMATINNEQAMNIGNLLSTELYSVKQISLMTDCSENIVSSILNGDCWRFVYNYYNLGEKHIPKYREVFNFDELNSICKYFEDNDIKELTLEVKKDILNGLGKECNYNNKKIISRIFRRKDHKNISSNYNF